MAAKGDRPARVQRQAMAVYPVVDMGVRGVDRGAQVATLVSAALRGGATMIQLREKGERVAEVMALAARVRPRLREAAALLVINDRLDLALAAGADGLHVGQHDMPVADARAAAEQGGRDDLIIGASVTTVQEARLAVAAGADYLSISPVFGTATKPDIDRPAGLDGVRAVRAAFPELPVVAIGGITPARVAEVISAGADGVAFVSALGARPESGVRAMAQAVQAARSSGQPEA